MKGLVREGNGNWKWQCWIPVRFRHLFDGKKKYIVSLKTKDEAEAIQRAREAQAEFNTRCGLSIPEEDPTRIPMIAGFVCSAVMYRGERCTLTVEEIVDGQLRQGIEDEHPLLHDFVWGGPNHRRLIEFVEVFARWAERGTGPSKTRDAIPTRKLGGRSIYDTAEDWASKPNTGVVPSTAKQYVADARAYAEWAQSTDVPAAGRLITKAHVNSYAEYLMSKSTPIQTIRRKFAALRKVYKAGRFSDDNPFTRITDRIDLVGPQLEIRGFTDQEAREIIARANRAGDRGDFDLKWAILIAAHSGARLGEICSLRIPEDWRCVVVDGKPRYVFSLTKSGGRRLKTKNSYRPVPIHHSLVPGLIAFMGQRKGKLIQSKSSALSKRWNSLIDWITTDPEVRGHAFRHTVATKLADAGVRKEIRTAIEGHAGVDAHDGYTHAERIREITDAINLLDYYTDTQTQAAA